MDSETKPKALRPKGRALTCIQLVGGIYCHICNQTYEDKNSFETHYKTHNTGDSIVYTCLLCRLQITTYSVFRDHYYRRHLIKDKFKCYICTKVFSKHKSLEDHMSKMHYTEDTTIKCNIGSCTQTFDTLERFHLHKLIHKKNLGSPPYACKNCNKLITNKDVCEEHIEEHCIFTYNCPICNKQVTKANATDHLSEHFGTSHDEEVIDKSIESLDDSSVNIVGGILCMLCEDTFKSNHDYILHFNSDHPDEPMAYWCNVCNKEWAKYKLLARHCYEHLVRDKFKCDSCNKSFRRLSMLVEHNNRVHLAEGPSSNSLWCGRAGCGAVFGTPRSRRMHLREVHGLGPHICDHCEHGFKSSKELTQHMLQHVGASNNWCRRCGMQFTSRSAAVNHLDAHKEKEYSCPVCERKFKEKYSSIHHIAQHFETILHMCNVCSKVYPARHRLVEHIKTHAEKNKYGCKFCDKTFAKIRQLREHINIHTGDSPYECYVCPKTFRSRPNWYKHLTTVHKVAKDELKEFAKKKPQRACMLDDLDIVKLPPTPMESDDSTMDSGVVDPGVLDLVDPALVDAINAGLLDVDAIHPHIVEAMDHGPPDPPDHGLVDLDTGLIQPVPVPETKPGPDGWAPPQNADINDPLPAGIADFITESVPIPATAPPIPCEYGPDFAGSVELDTLDTFETLAPAALSPMDPRFATQPVSVPPPYQETDPFPYEAGRLPAFSLPYSSTKLVPYGTLYADFDDPKYEFNTDIF